MQISEMRVTLEWPTCFPSLSKYVCLQEKSEPLPLGSIVQTFYVLFQFTVSFGGFVVYMLVISVFLGDCNLQIDGIRDPGP